MLKLKVSSAFLAMLPICQIAKLQTCKLPNCELAIMERNPFRSCFSVFMTSVNVSNYDSKNKHFMCDVLIEATYGLSILSQVFEPKEATFTRGMMF